MKQLIKERIYPDPNHPNAAVLSRSNGKNGMI